MVDITVVIPTYNRRALLRAAVDSLRQQTFPAERYEIVIVSDGSTDGSDDDYATPLAAPITRLVRQAKQGFGLARARNNGLRAAHGRLVMYFDDDMVADAQLVEAHVSAHTRFDDHVAICGQVRLAPELPQTPFCQIVLGDICRLFADNPDESRFLSYAMALSWQTSFVRTELERLGGYDETFQCYGWEDIEFSYRAAQKEMRFYYEPGAISFHNDQRNTLEAHAQRLRNSAKMAPMLFQRHPQLRGQIDMYADKLPINWQGDGPGLIAKKAMRRVLATSPVMLTLRGLTPWLERMRPAPTVLRRWYYAVLSNYIYLGYREGLANGGSPPTYAA
jgi:glycosyltransferase involved in cell wall biosynthesis